MDNSRRPAEVSRQPSDPELVAHLASGSEEALATLYDRHARSVFATSRRLGADPTGAEEVVQETFLALWNRAESFDPAIGSLESWLLAIARNRTIDRFRAAGRRVPALPFSSVAAEEPDEGATVDWLIASGDVLAAARPAPEPERAVFADEERDELARALVRLDDQELRPILLAYRDGLSQSEVAAVLGWPLGTVKTRTRRGLHLLREFLAPEIHEEADEEAACATC